MVHCLEFEFSWSYPTVAVIHCVEILVGVLTNVGVLWVFAKTGKWRGTSPALMKNLALCDLCICSLAIPLAVAAVFKSTNPMDGLAVARDCSVGYFRLLSVCTLVLISQDRRSSITQLVRRKEPFRIRRKLWLLWTMPLPFSLMPLLVYLIRDNDAKCRVVHAQEQSLPWILTISYHLATVVIYGILFALLFRNYHFVRYATRRRISMIPRILPHIRCLPRATIREERVLRLSTLAGTCSVICWMPLLSYQLVVCFLTHSNTMQLVEAFLLAIGFVNPIINPFLYSAQSSHWRNALSRLFRDRLLRGTKVESTKTES